MVATIAFITAIVATATWRPPFDRSLLYTSLPWSASLFGWEEGQMIRQSEKGHRESPTHSPFSNFLPSLPALAGPAPRFPLLALSWVLWAVLFCYSLDFQKLLPSSHPRREKEGMYAICRSSGLFTLPVLYMHVTHELKCVMHELNI